MRDELGFETVITGYGLTECCGIVSMCRFDDDPETIATTSGRAIPGIEVRCVGKDGREVPRGEPGEVVVRGYNVMRGYFEDPAETAKTIDADGWLHTGDIAVMDARGYLRITDRIKDMFIVGGFNCYPAEIENLMYGSGLFAQVAVVGVPDERMGEVGMAFVVPAPGKEVTARGRDRLVSREHGQLQGPAPRRDRPVTAGQRGGQGDEVRTARAREALRPEIAAPSSAPGRNNLTENNLTPGTGFTVSGDAAEGHVDHRVDHLWVDLAAGEEEADGDRADDQVGGEVEVEVGRDFAARDGAFECLHERGASLQQDRIEEFGEGGIVRAFAGERR